MLRSCLVVPLFAILAWLPLRAADIEFVTQELPWAIVDRAYSAPPLETRTSGACPLGGVGYAIVSGGLPDGVGLSRLGYFSGIPTRTGAYEFAVRVSNGCTWTARHYILTVTGSPILTVNPLRLSFTWKMGAKPPPPQVLRVSATWPRFNYSVSSNALWLRATPEHGFTPRASSAMAEDFVMVGVDPGELSAGRYSSQIVLSAWEALNVPPVIVEFTVVEGEAAPRGQGTSGTPSPTGSPTSASRP